MMALQSQTFRDIYYPLRRSNKKQANINDFPQDPRLQEFKKMFQKIAKSALQSFNKANKHDVQIFHFFDKVIPNEYFGSKKNRKSFYKIVKKYLSRSSLECVLYESFFRNFRHQDVPWLNNILIDDETLCKKLLFKANKWLFEKVVKPIVDGFYSTVKAGLSYQLHLILRPQWQSYESKVLHELIKKKYIIYTPNITPEKVRGYMQIIPKTNYIETLNDCRMIMKLSQRKNKQKYSSVSKFLYRIAQRNCPAKTEKLYDHWARYVEVTCNKKIYGIKVDVQDAFGSIKINVLIEILTKLHKMKKISADTKNFAQRCITNQYVFHKRIKAKPTNILKIWKWNHGLLQGDRLSSALCELYMSYLDSIHLRKFCGKNHFLHRNVDDYFFCSTDKSDVQTFFNTMTNIHTLNKNKTQSNVEIYCKDDEYVTQGNTVKNDENEINENMQNCFKKYNKNQTQHEIEKGDIDKINENKKIKNGNRNEISYSGHIFLMDTKEVRCLYKFSVGTELRYRFKLWNINPLTPQNADSKSHLLWVMSYRYCAHHFTKLRINTVFNDESTAVQNYFESMIYVAYKFDTILMVLYEKEENLSFIDEVKLIVGKYAFKVHKKLEMYNGTSNKSEIVPLKVLIVLGYTALILVLKKRPVHTVLVDEIKNVQNSIKFKGSRYTHKLFTKFPPLMFDNIALKRILPEFVNFE